MSPPTNAGSATRSHTGSIAETPGAPEPLTALTQLPSAIPIATPIAHVADQKAALPARKRAYTFSM